MMFKETSKIERYKEVENKRWRKDIPGKKFFKKSCLHS